MLYNEAVYKQIEQEHLENIMIFTRLDHSSTKCMPLSVESSIKFNIVLTKKSNKRMKLREGLNTCSNILKFKLVSLFFCFIEQHKQTRFTFQSKTC